ncbi:sulfhydryl oxidase 2 isoform X2 [Entelurus aequoreus]|uniref:sulfhydryl oxidase 2 isoform X2 n=1 Tax=Entelurus aequoreus TaxID=161455 RepID=UPI002B1E33FD|nr:sulfhydryl oxidase 2 isoform X2 [Entelurus aequoreus]
MLGMFRFCWTVSLTLQMASAVDQLYSEDDQLAVLSGVGLKSAVTNSSSAWLVQFFSSWCGHCVHFSATWKALARDVQDWQQVINMAVLDCAQEDNYDACKEYNIKFYPTFKYFHAHCPPTDKGTTYRGADRQVQSMRRLMVDILQNHTREHLPDHCPPLEPWSSAQIFPLLGQRSSDYSAVIVEEAESYVGREVTLDLLQYSGVHVRRALSSDRPLLDALNTSALPSVYLLHPNGTHAHLHAEKRQRFFFTSLLRTLPGVHRRWNSARSPSRWNSARSPSRWNSARSPSREGPSSPHSSKTWRHFDSSKVYTADLESALHYLLRVELASHPTLEGEELRVFKDFVTLVAKLYPGGGPVVKLMETLSDWLHSLPLQQIPYQAVLDLVDNKMKIPGVFLGAGLNWVGCQGSRDGLRGYPCALWTLFHVLTLQLDATPRALAHTGLDAEGAPVLKVMRGYMKNFFGCEDCGRHFEKSSSTLTSVYSPQEEVLWLWRQHNMVNSRLAGSLSEDPMFPKGAWPSPSLCPSCHEEKNGVHVWDLANVLSFLRRHYGADNLSSAHAAIPPTPDAAHSGRPPLRPQTEALLKPGAGVWTLAAGFNGVDMSLCVVLYVSSCLLLMLLFFFFRVRSRRWRHPRLPL